MHTIYSAKNQLSISLSKALEQTYLELQTLRSLLHTTRNELTFLKMQNQTLLDENSLLRDRNGGFEEEIKELKEKQIEACQAYKEACKQENAKVAKVLRRTLLALKDSKTALERLQEQCERLDQENSALLALKEPLIYELQELYQDRLELTHLLFGPKSPALEQKLMLVEEAYQTLKTKAREAIVSRDEELKRLKVENRELLSKSKEDEVIKAKVPLLIKRMDESASQQVRLTRTLSELQESLCMKERECEELAIKEEDLQVELKRMHEREKSQGDTLNQKEMELTALYQMKSEYERMHKLFNNIKACMGPELPDITQPLSSSVDLFSFQKSKNRPIQEELF